MNCIFCKQRPIAAGSQCILCLACDCDENQDKFCTPHLLESGAGSHDPVSWEAARDN